MPYDPQKHHRRSIRLRGYDYTQAGAYFVTICTRDQESFFDNPDLADVVRATWRELPNRFPTIALDAFVVMPNHVHFIVWLNPVAVVVGVSSVVGASLTDAPTDAPTNDAPMTTTNGGPAYTIRNERELNAIRKYIRDNPARWAEDIENSNRTAVRQTV